MCTAAVCLHPFSRRSNAEAQSVCIRQSGNETPLNLTQWTCNLHHEHPTYRRWFSTTTRTQLGWVMFPCLHHTNHLINALDNRGTHGTCLITFDYVCHDFNLFSAALDAPEVCRPCLLNTDPLPLSLLRGWFDPFVDSELQPLLKQQHKLRPNGARMGFWSCAPLGRWRLGMFSLTATRQSGWKHVWWMSLSGVSFVWAGFVDIPVAKANMLGTPARDKGDATLRAPWWREMCSCVAAPLM